MPEPLVFATCAFKIGNLALLGPADRPGAWIGGGETPTDVAGSEFVRGGGVRGGLRVRRVGMGIGSILVGPVGDGELAESLTPLMEV